MFERVTSLAVLDGNGGSMTGLETAPMCPAPLPQHGGCPGALGASKVRLGTWKRLGARLGRPTHGPSRTPGSC